MRAIGEQMYNPPLEKTRPPDASILRGWGLILLDHSQSHNYLLITDLPEHLFRASFCTIGTLSPLRGPLGPGRLLIPLRTAMICSSECCVRSWPFLVGPIAAHPTFFADGLHFRGKVRYPVYVGHSLDL